jgi:hypothetical protein
LQAYAFDHRHRLAGIAPAGPAPSLGLKNFSSPIERIAGEQHALDPLAVLRPLLNLVKVAMVGEERLVSSIDQSFTRRYPSRPGSGFGATRT